MSKYEVTWSVEGYYTWTGEASSKEDARVRALEASSELDCGDLENVDLDLVSVERI